MKRLFGRTGGDHANEDVRAQAAAELDRAREAVRRVVPAPDQPRPRRPRPSRPRSATLGARRSIAEPRPPGN